MLLTKEGAIPLFDYIPLQIYRTGILKVAQTYKIIKNHCKKLYQGILDLQPPPHFS